MDDYPTSEKRTHHGTHPCPACDGVAEHWYLGGDEWRYSCENGCTPEAMHRAGLALRATLEEQQRLAEIKLTRGSVVNADTALFEVPALPRAMWGSGERILSARHEALMFAAETGVGKTTAAQNLALAMVRVGGRDSFLGYDVAETERVLYIAADRPGQALASLRRMVDPKGDRKALRDRLAIHQGPPEQRITVEPEALAKLASRERATTVVIDSLKDVVLGSLADDSTGAAVAMALQVCAADGIDVVVCHHTTKLGARSPDLNSVYGSALITATCGSVYFMTGGDVVRFRHLKRPSERVDVEARLDVASGAFYATDLLELVAGGVTLRDVSIALFGSDDPRLMEKARRKLEADDRITKTGGGRGRGNAALYVPRVNHDEEPA